MNLVCRSPYDQAEAVVFHVIWSKFWKNNEVGNLAAIYTQKALIRRWANPGPPSGRYFDSRIDPAPARQWNIDHIHRES